MANSIEAQGQTVDEAIQIALNQLGVSRDKVEIEILHHPRRGLLGIGARRAKVRATVRESVMLDGEEFDMSGGSDLDDKPRRRRRRGGRNRPGGRDDRPETAPLAAPRSTAPAPAREPGRSGEGERRGDGRRGGEGDSGRGRGDGGGRGRDDRRGGGRGRQDGRQEPRSDQRGDQRGERPGGGEPRADAQPRTGQDQPREGGGRQEPRESGGRQEPREGGGRNDQRGDRSQRGRQQQQPRDQGDRRDRGRSQQRDRSADNADFPSPVAEGSSPPSDTGPRFASEMGTEPRAPRENAHRRPPAAEEPPLDAAALEAIRERAVELVQGLLSRMGFAAEVTSSIDESAGEAVVSVRSESEGLLIGRRGQTLDSLEYIVNRMALRGDAYVEGRVLLDIGDYRRRRRESLEELATRLRVRAVGERRTVQVSPMSPRDRRFLAQAFANDDAVELRAVGAGFYRRVIVAPAGMGAAAFASAESAMDIEDAGVDSGYTGAEAES